ncbi:3-beta-hydroxysteroid sulfotransferase-like [Dermacentor andersoni]|uniref:3-beta-hydroxysteroid sulfotransferase-like n=1 Tax=Dermacentor andersoni TaxID=34620 RepID=UPI0024172D4A|nr:3-beta-hydroxysteroid sulfotransferase-like [Dermacentor andersoni]
MELRKPLHQVIDGVPRCVGVVPEILRENLKFRAQKGDVVQSTFPKAGTHWMLYIVQLILRDGGPMTTYKEFAKELRFIDYADIKGWKSSLAVRTFSTHLPLSEDTISEEGKYIYVARNPWDVCVSLYHMVTNLSSFEYQDATFEEFVNVFVSEDFGYGDYFEHVALAYKLRQQPNVLFVTYEEMKKDTRDVILKVAHFLGEPYGRALLEDETLLHKVLESSKPERMRSVVVVDFYNRPNPHGKKVTCKQGYEGDETKYALVRTAKVGGWKEHFTPELLRRMEARISEAEMVSSFMDLWKDMRAEAFRLS